MTFGIHCPRCSSTRTGVYNTSDSPEGITRNRKCKVCTFTFATLELIRENPRPSEYKKIMARLRLVERRLTQLEKGTVK